jgi:hypothetical protein
MPAAACCCFCWPRAVLILAHGCGMLVLILAHGCGMLVLILARGCGMLFADGADRWLGRPQACNHLHASNHTLMFVDFVQGTQGQLSATCRSQSGRTQTPSVLEPAHASSSHQAASSEDQGSHDETRNHAKGRHSAAGSLSHTWSGGSLSSHGKATHVLNEPMAQRAGDMLSAGHTRSELAAVGAALCGSCSGSHVDFEATTLYHDAGSRSMHAAHATHADHDGRSVSMRGKVRQRAGVAGDADFPARRLTVTPWSDMWGEALEALRNRVREAQVHVRADKPNEAQDTTADLPSEARPQRARSTRAVSQALPEGERVRVEQRLDACDNDVMDTATAQRVEVGLGDAEACGGHGQDSRLRGLADVHAVTGELQGAASVYVCVEGFLMRGSCER